MLRALLSFALALGPRPAPVSEHERVQQLAVQAAEAFEREDYDAAARYLQQALEREPENPALLYGLAQARRGTNDCAEAIALYDRFLRTDPTPRQRADALEGRRKCGATSPPPSARPDPPPPDPPPQSPTPAVDTPPPRLRSRVGPALVGTGGGLVLVGGSMVGAAFAVAGRAPSAATQQDYEDRSARVRPLAVTGWSVLAVGVTVAVAGTITWILDRRRTDRARARRRGPALVAR